MSNKTWTRQEEEIVKEERRQGTEVADVAAMLGRTASSDSGKISDLKDRKFLVHVEKVVRIGKNIFLY